MGGYVKNSRKKTRLSELGGKLKGHLVLMPTFLTSSLPPNTHTYTASLFLQTHTILPLVVGLAGIFLVH